MTTLQMDAEQITDDVLFGEGTPPGTKVDDATAPYGFTRENAPRAKPGRKPGQKTGTGRAAAKTAPAPPRKAIPVPKPPAPKKTTVDYRPALMNIGGELIGSAALWGLMKDNMVMLSDAAAVGNAFPAIVDGVNTAADKWPLVASILDKFLPLAEFGKSGGSVVIMMAQIAVNHGKIPPGMVPGTATPDRLVSSFIGRQMLENPEFAEAIAAIQAQKGQPVAAS